MMIRHPAALQHDLQEAYQSFDNEWAGLWSRYALLEAVFKNDADTLAKSDDPSRASARIEAESIIAKHGPSSAHSQMMIEHTHRIADLYQAHRARMAEYDRLAERSRRYFSRFAQG